MSDLDQTRPVREGEELDAQALAAWLAPRVEGFEAPLTIEQFPGGHSNLTYLLRDANGAEFVLRRPPKGAGRIKAGHDMLREHRILSALHPVFPKVPKPLAASEEETSPLGMPFYVMERARGVILRNRVPKALELGPERMRALSEAFVDQLVELHAVDWQAAGLATLGRPQGYVARQVKGWTERWQRARTDDIPQMDQVASWLAGHLPEETAATLIHNDFKYDNLVLDPADLSRIVSLLDWEMATIGDPLSDVGMSLAYWVQADDPEELRMMKLGLTHLPGNLTREELAAAYAERSGRNPRDLAFFYVLGLFKVAVIAQQIYFRYVQGLTKDERFASFLLAVGLLARQAVRVSETGRLGAG